MPSYSSVFFRVLLVLRSASGRVSKDAGRQTFRSSFETAAVQPPQDEILSNRSFKADRDQLLRFNRKLHRQLLQHVLHKPIDDQTDGFFLRQPALGAVEQH